MNPTRTLTARAAILVAAVGLLLTGCGAKTPDALVRREVAPAVTSDVTKPCTREAAQSTAPADPAPAGLAATFDAAGDKIVLSGGQNVTVPALAAKLTSVSSVKALAAVIVRMDMRNAPGKDRLKEWLRAARRLRKQ